MRRARLSLLFVMAALLAGCGPGDVRVKATDAPREGIVYALAAADAAPAPMDPCADYGALEAGTGAPERQDGFNHLDARGYARWRMACTLAWGADQYGCLDALWSRESGWNHLAHNSSSGAHGVPQALPGSKMGEGWWDNPRVQVRWGVDDYIPGRYGNPCNAWSHFQRRGWY